MTESGFKFDQLFSLNNIDSIFNKVSNYTKIQFALLHCKLGLPEARGLKDSAQDLSCF